MKTKEQEISAIRALVGMDGYFAEFFGGDLEKMCENIRNDFPIELNTKINGAAEYLQQRNDETVKKHALEILDLVDTFLCVYDETGDKRLYERAVEKIGMRNVIARKRALGLRVTGDEVDFLLNNSQSG
jgi:hypothetical protein